MDSNDKPVGERLGTGYDELGTVSGKAAGRAGKDDSVTLSLSKGPLRLNLGCGADVREGWDNLDRNPAVYQSHEAVTRCDVFGRLPYDDESVAEIYAGHVLEHESYHRIPEVIEEWVRVLRPGGLITIAVPDFEAIAQDYATHKMQYLTAIITLFGAQQDRYDYHKTAIDWAMIAGQLQHWGCENVQRLASHKPYELLVQASKKGALD